MLTGINVPWLVDRPAESVPVERHDDVPRDMNRWLAQLLTPDVEAITQICYAAFDGEPAIVVPSPPGAGKTRLVVNLALALSEEPFNYRVGIACQTHEQLSDVAGRLAAGGASHAGVVLGSQKARTTSQVQGVPVVKSSGRMFTDGGGVVVATTAKWAWLNQERFECDVIIVDEAWQSTFGDVAALGAFSGRMIYVGDPGQIEPVVTGATQRWEHRVAAPHHPAPVAVVAQHENHVVQIPLTQSYRLGPDTAALVSDVFYADLPFVSARPNEHVSVRGNVLPEMAAVQVNALHGPNDGDVLTAVADHVGDVLADGVYVTEAGGSRPLLGSDIAVIAAHVSQVGALQALLAGSPEVTVGTANQLQGSERPVVMVVHPLLGYREFSEGGKEMSVGRLCVMASRHRAHMTMFIDDSSVAALRQHMKVAGASKDMIVHDDFLRRILP